MYLISFGRRRCYVLGWEQADVVEHGSVDVSSRVVVGQAEVALRVAGVIQEPRRHWGSRDRHLNTHAAQTTLLQGYQHVRIPHLSASLISGIL